MINWKKKKLSELCNKIGDGLHGTPEYTANSDIFFINGNNLKNGKIIITPNTKKITDSVFKKNFIHLNDNSLLLSINGTLGNMAFFNGEKLMLGKSAAYLNFKTEINKFYYYYFQLPGVQQYFHNVATGSTIKNLSLKSIQDFLVPLPQEKEWKEIAAVLTALDAKIELNKKINTKLEAMAKLLYDYWFVQFDFPNENAKPYKSSGGKMVYNEQLKREIPAGWEVKELSEVANITMGQSPSGISYNDEGFGTIFFQGATDFGWRFPTIRQYTTEPSRFAQKGDILLSVRAPVGTLNIADSDCCIGRGLASLCSKEGFTSYLFYVMEYFKQLFDHRNNSGTTFGSITKDDLFSLKLAYPQKELLVKYNNAVSKYNEKILNNHKENQRLTALRDWLLPMLMNGQVRVK